MQKWYGATEEDARHRVVSSDRLLRANKIDSI